MELNYKTFGQGDPVIILHGLFGTLDNWQTIARKLSEQYTVYIVDQRNHGRSPHLPDMSYELMAEDLCRFMEQHWIFRAAVIGHSMGGKTAMQFALNNPDMVERLVVIDIAPKAYAGGHQDIFEALFDVKLTELESREAAEQILARRIPEAGVRQFLLKNLTREKEGSYAWKMNLFAIYRHYPDILAAVGGPEPFEGPALFVRGEKSDYITNGDQELIRRLFPKARLETVQGAGHWVHADAPQSLLELILQFLHN